MATFFPKFYIVQDLHTKIVKGVARVQRRIYYMINESTREQEDVISSATAHNQVLGQFRPSSRLVNRVNQEFNRSNSLDGYALWHHSLGHDPLNMLKCIPNLSSLDNKKGDICVTCSMTKFTKLPFPMI